MYWGLRKLLGFVVFIHGISVAFAQTVSEFPSTESVIEATALNEKPMSVEADDLAQTQATATEGKEVVPPNPEVAQSESGAASNIVTLDPIVPSLLDSGSRLDPNCVVSANRKCALQARHRDIEFFASAAGKVFFVFGSRAVEREQENFEFSEAEYIFVHEDLYLRLENGEIAPDEADIIASELEPLEGAYYEIPDIHVLKVDLGFPAETQFALEDLRELVRTHLQISLGVGPITSAYLCERMGVQLAEEFVGGSSGQSRSTQ